MTGLSRRHLVPVLAMLPAVRPRMAAAEQSNMPVVGCLFIGTPERSAWWLEAWRKGLAEYGFVEGRNLAVEYRWAEGDPGRLPALAADLVGRRVDAIVTTTEQAAAAAKEATTTIPIVFYGITDPVGKGLVKSLVQPGGNLTGTTNMGADVTLMSKRLQLLHELVPAATRIGYLADAHDAPFRQNQMEEVAAAAKTLGLDIVFLTAGNAEEIEAAFASGKRSGIGALLVQNPASFLYTQQKRILELAARHALPAASGDTGFAANGGLFWYSFDSAEAPYMVGTYVARILKGDSPAGLPVVQPTKTKFVINLKTAKTLGLTVPPPLLAAADDVIE